MPERAKIIGNGRLVIPAKIRKAMGLEEGDIVWLDLQGEELRIRPARSALRRIQNRLKDLAPSTRFASEALIADRRIEAADD